MSKKYYWEKEIINVVDNTITLEWDKEIYLTDKQLSYLVTNEKQDLTQLQNLMIKNVNPELLNVLEAHNIRKWDFQAILATLVSSFNEWFNQAIWKAFWTYEEWIHSDNFTDNIRVSDIDKLMKI